MNKHFESPRARRYPAGERAMRGYMIIERLPAAQRSPRGHVNMWPDYEALRHAEHYSRLSTGEVPPDKIDSREIDRAMAWIQPCACMWPPGRDKRDWQLFCSYAQGVLFSENS